MIAATVMYGGLKSKFDASGWSARVYTIQIDSHGSVDVPSMEAIEKLAPSSCKVHHSKDFCINCAEYMYDWADYLLSGAEEMLSNGIVERCFWY